jgi:hypothetical protein
MVGGPSTNPEISALASTFLRLAEGSERFGGGNVSLLHAITTTVAVPCS